MIASPTAASAAATVITMKTNNGPPISPKNEDNETSARFTALSISSMHRKMVIALRLMKTPTAPMRNKRAESPKYQVRGAIKLIVLPPGKHHCAHHRHQNQHRCNFKWQQVVGKQRGTDAPRSAYGLIPTRGRQRRHRPRGQPLQHRKSIGNQQTREGDRKVPQDFLILHLPLILGDGKEPDQKQQKNQ